MHHEWQQFLSRQQTPVTATAAIAEQSILTDLSAYGLLQVQGDDAEGFLQNQFGNDVRLVSDHSSQLSSYCTPKGRMLSVFRLFKFGGAYYLRMPAGLIDSMRKRLQMYVLRSKVALADASADWVRFGIAGPGSEQQLQKRLGSVPADINGASSGSGWHLTRVPGNERFECIASSEHAESIWQQLQAQHSVAHADTWPLLDILNGIPTVYPPTSEHFVPQMTNMQLIGGVSFKKGCYPGQEIVARMQYRGTLKRRMHLIQIKTATPPAAGTAVVSISDGKSHEAGEIVDARMAGEDCLALAVLQISSLQEPLHIGDETGPQLQLLEMPYAFT